MVGSSESVLGREIEPVLHRFATGLPKRFYVNDRDVVIHGAIVEFDIKTGLASNIERIKKPVPNED